ncbi:MAG: nitrite/sulfite reductase [Alphaproteobacteria bacterium]
MTAFSAIAGNVASEPLSRASDIDEYRSAFTRYTAGEWDDERWTAFRLRFGVYGQRQPGVQMVRIKVPGGVLPTAWAHAVAGAARRYARGDVHVTTRQDFQIYFVPLDATPDLLATLGESGVTTREACGNTLRNMSACALAGVCPRERVDAGKVAERLARSWIRHPLVQHMPRKFKVSVSGCATDCGASSIHDLGLVATVKNGEPGFRVYGGGGLGGVPRTAVLLSDFVVEQDLPAVIEALVRLHQRYSNRKNRNAARIKFLVKRFGEDRFRALFREEFARARTLPQRPWEALDWREPIDAPEPVSPGGVVWQHDGRMSVVVSLSLGLLSADQLDGLADIAERYAFDGLRTTREQNIAILGIEPEVVREVVDAVRAIGLTVEETVGDTPDVVSCPGTTTCRLGITNSQNFGREIHEAVRNYAPLPAVRVRISGCQNACGLHQIGDFGFRGMGKKIDGRHAPHYQIYIGGNGRNLGEIGLAGPIVPALHAKRALELLLDGYAQGRENGESVRDWALRLDKKGLAALLAPIEALRTGDDKRIYVDWGDSETFEPPSITHGECAAGFALDSLYKDLADDGLIRLDRAILSDAREAALEGGRAGLVNAARRLLLRLGQTIDEDEDPAVLVARTRAAYADDDTVTAALDDAAAGEAAARAGGGLDAWREALAVLIDAAAELAGKPAAPVAIDLSRLGDFDATVLELIGGRTAAE